MCSFGMRWIVEALEDDLVELEESELEKDCHECKHYQWEWLSVGRSFHWCNFEGRKRIPPNQEACFNHKEAETHV